MSEGDHANLRRIFEAVMEAGPGERDGVLARECGDDVLLRRRVEAMIAHAEDDRFLGAPTASISAGPSDSDPSPSRERAGVERVVRAVLGEGPGTQIGPYRLLELIGEGGFGSVFMAEQRSSVVRTVALKIIKLGMDTRQVIARFEQERQALAIMDHPNIARVFDAGATEAGRPYFVMELVKGDPIVEYCDKHNLSIPDRLRLFAQVCHAVQHAHTKGIIHRDIKPSNVLVATQDGVPQAKIIDFGIAKATASKLTEKTLFTEHRTLVGTPEYMSPEQAEGSKDIDTRTDVYSLGVLLYELLTGSTPFTGEQLRSAAYADIQRIIREVDPPRPSTRLTDSSDTIRSIASKRRTEPRRLGTIVRGELDWIVMKALEKDRRRRYETASGLGLDIQRHLDGQPVLAAPTSNAYKLRKFVRRHRPMVAAGCAVGLSLLIGLVGFAWQAHAARLQRDRALVAEAAAERRADELAQVSAFQSRMLAGVDASAAGLRLISDARDRYGASLDRAGVAESDRVVMSAAFAEAWSRLSATDMALGLIDSTILAPALDEIDRRFAGQPVIDARLRRAIAERYLDLGLVESSWAVAQRLAEVLETAVGEDDPATIDAMILRARLLTQRGESVVAEAELRGLLDRHLGDLGADHPLMLNAKSELGAALMQGAEYAEAEAFFREVLEARRRTLGDDDELTLVANTNVAAALREQGRYTDAEPFEREALEVRRRVLGEDHPSTIQSLRNISVLLFNQGRLVEAEEAGARVVDSARRVLGEVHPTTLLVIGNLASMMDRNGKTLEAERLQREMVERVESVLGPDHPNTINAVSNLATYLIPLGRFEEAEPLCRRALESRLRLLGRNHPSTLVSFNVMGFLMQRQNRASEAMSYLREAFDVSGSIRSEDHPEHLVLLINVGSLAAQLGDAEQAERSFREAIERVTRTLGEDHPYFGPAIQSLGDLLVRERRFAEAVELLSGAEGAFRRKAAIRDDGALARLLLNLGVARAETGAFSQGEANLIEAHTAFATSISPTSPRVRQCADALVRLYGAWHAAEPEGGHDVRLAEWVQRRADAEPREGPGDGP